MAWLMLSVGIIPAQMFLPLRRPVWSDLLGAVAGVLAFSLTRMRYHSLAAAVILSVIVLRGLSPFQWRANPAAFSWMPFASMIDASWRNATLSLLEKMYYTSAAIWSLCFAGVRLRVSIVIVSVLLLGIETAQTMLPGRTPDMTDPVLAVLIGYRDRCVQTNFQPLRNFGFRYSFASLLFVNRIFSASHISLPSNFMAITPSSIHCTNGPATLKFEHDGSPPLQARIQSR